MQAMILAAGFGTRLRPLTEQRPKPLFPVFDTPLLLLLIEQLQQAGCRKILVNCHHLAGQILAALSSFPDVSVLREQTILGTGGALRQALPLLDDEPLLVINSDIVQNFDLYPLYQAHGRTGSPVTMVTHHYPRFASLEVNAAGQVRHIGQVAKEYTQQKLAFTGVHIIEPAIIERIPPGKFYGIIDLYQHLIAEGSFPYSICINDRYWRDIGTIGDYLAVHAEILASPSLFASLPQRLKATGFISPSALIGNAVEIIDWAVVGAKAIVEEGVVLQRCIVWDKARVAPGTKWVDTVVV